MTIDEVIKRLKESRSTIQPYRYVNEALDSAIDGLEELKQLRAEKEKCARWTLEKHLGLDILFCSNCGRDLNCNDYGEHYIEHFKYCPYCGAKMELKGGR